MCLFSRIIRNKKYEPNKKNGGIVPAVNDERTLWVAVGCGDCMECRKQKKREWQVRLMEDIIHNTNGKFVTLTFSTDSLKKLYNWEEKKRGWPSMKLLEGYAIDNEIAKRGIRLFLERWRRKHGKSLRHWFVTELGQPTNEHGNKNMEHIHIHGIIWTNETVQTVAERWEYGYIWPRYNWKNNYVNAKTVNYIIKYISKVDFEHKTYKSKILTSSGIGAEYVHKKIKSHTEEWLHRDKYGRWTLRKYQKYEYIQQKGDNIRNKYKPEGTNETYRTNSGHKIAMPIYWRNKIYTDEEREKLWIEKLDKQIRYVGGEEVDISENMDKYFELLKHYQKINNKLGYGKGEKDWSQAEYEKQRRNMIHGERIM